MTTRTIPAKPKPPGKVTRAVRRNREQAAKAALPYAGSVAASLAADLALHQPLLLGVGLGAAGMHAGLRIAEEHGWHRKGGKAAARKRRKYQGTATRRDIRRHLSPAAARKRAAITSPGLHPSEAPVIIARAKGRTIAGSREDSYLLIAPPRTGKTALLGCWLADAPGPALATSTRTDLYAHTAIPRSSRGDIHVLNPDSDGGIPSTLAWSPVDGCEDPAAAMQRASYLMDAAPHDPGGKDAHWDHLSKDMLQFLLHAAALLGETIMTVRGWASDPARASDAVQALRCGPAPDWAASLAALVYTSSSDDRHWSAISSGVRVALAWLDDRVLAHQACPAPGTGFDAAQFLADGTGTVYLIGADRPHGSLAPYFAAFTAHLFETAKRLASTSPGGRLPRPLTLCLDEAAITCPVPLHKWTSEAGGHGVTVMAAVQSKSQLHSRWGEHDGATIFSNSTVKVFYGGETRHEDLEAISAVCGDRDTWDVIKNPDGSKTRQPRSERTVPPERIRMLGVNEALVLHRATRPVIGTVTPVWDRPGYQRAPLGPAASPRTTAQHPAIEAPRQATPMPGPSPHPAIPAPVPALEVAPWHETVSSDA